MPTANINIKFTDANGSESSKSIKRNSKLSSLLKTGQSGIVNGEAMPGTTTLRAGDHVEVNVISGKAAA